MRASLLFMDTGGDMSNQGGRSPIQLPTASLVWHDPKYMEDMHMVLMYRTQIIEIYPSNGKTGWSDIRLSMHTEMHHQRYTNNTT